MSSLSFARESVGKMSVMACVTYERRVEKPRAATYGSRLRILRWHADVVSSSSFRVSLRIFEQKRDCSQSNWISINVDSFCKLPHAHFRTLASAFQTDWKLKLPWVACNVYHHINHNANFSHYGRTKHSLLIKQLLKILGNQNKSYWVSSGSVSPHFDAMCVLGMRCWLSHRHPISFHGRKSWSETG